jgi:8-oxo-dGTP pyrophosphatase MutT (NUDIX family)
MLILEREDGAILLGERAGTGYDDGKLNLPSGKAEPGESVLDAVVREAREEIGITLDPDRLRLVHAMQFRNAEGEVRVGWFFGASHWDGEPVNTEPHKCAGLSWHAPDHLPDHTVPYNALGIAHYLKGEPLSVHGWHDLNLPV